MAPNFPKGVIEPLHFAKFGQRSAAKGGSIAPNFPKGVFKKFGAIEPLRFQTMKTAKGGSIAPNIPKGVFRKFGAIEPLRFQTMKTAKSGSIAPNFPNGVVSENLVLSNRCISENQDGKGRFDDKKVIEI